MGCPLWSIAIRPRLKISFEDRLQDVFKRTLNYAVADCGDRENADLGAPILRNLLLPHRHGPIRVVHQFVLHLFQKTLHSAFFDDFKRDSIDPRSVSENSSSISRLSLKRNAGVWEFSGHGEDV